MNDAPLTKILCVDDEPNILDAFKRQLRGSFDLDIAMSGEAALGKLSEKGPYAVVVSDMHMPGMDGVQFLQRVRNIAPETVRLMLTGNADQESAVRAVNEGNIFRFLNKPCSTEDLTKALQDAAAQHRLIVAEKELLQKTLSGSVKLLTDILAFMDPTSFGQSMKLRQLIQRVCSHMVLPNAWEVELAGMLSNIGFVTVPATVLSKHRKAQPLTPQEQELVEKVPVIGQSLITNIPRLEGVAKIVLYQNRRFDGAGAVADAVVGDAIPVGPRIIKVLKDLSEFEAAGVPAAVALENMRNRHGWYDSNILSVVAKILSGTTANKPQETQIYEIKSHQLFLGQTLLSNVETKDGVLLITAGSVVTETLIERITNYSKFVGIKEPIQVDCLIPTEEKERPETEAAP